MSKSSSPIGSFFNSLASIFRSSNHATVWLENTLAGYNVDSYNELKAKKAEFNISKEEIIELKEWRNELL